MGTLLDLASLVTIPSGYKVGTVYSVVPTDGAGDLTFTRSNDTATRVGPNGLIEKVRTNVALQSEAFDAASWLKPNATITANVGVAPNGTTTADKIVPTTTGTNRWVEQSRAITASIPYTNSFFVKADGFSWAAIHHIDGSVGAWFNVSSGTIGTITAGNTALITSVGNGWYRCSVAKISGGTTGYSVLQLADADNSLTATASGTNGLLIWGGQTETGDIATDYIPTTTTAVSVGPVANLPRLDYLNSTCPNLLLEPQRTNLVQFSEQLNNAGWAVSAVVTANTAVSPDGYTNADSVMESATTDFHIIGDPVTSVSGTTYTYSFFAKPNGRNFARILFGNGSFPDNQSAYFNLLTGATSASASVTASMVSYGNGWWRCIATCTSDASATDAVYLGPARNMTDSYNTYVGNASLGIYAYGVQQEAGAYGTSYVPTLAAASTRGEDACLKTGISSLIGQTEGTLFVQVNAPSGFDGNNLMATLSDGTTSNMIFINRVSGRAEYYVASGGVEQSAFASASVLSTGVHKLAVAYKQNDFVFYIDGVLINASTSGSVPAMSRINIGSYVASALPYNDGISEVVLFKTRLTNAELAQLTTI
jgi:hypothetical protein